MSKVLKLFINSVYGEVPQEVPLGWGLSPSWLGFALHYLQVGGVDGGRLNRSSKHGWRLDRLKLRLLCGPLLEATHDVILVLEQILVLHWVRLVRNWG